MANVTVVAAEVLPDSGSVMDNGAFGATVLAGETVYLDSATNTYKLADAGASTTCMVSGIAMNGGVLGQSARVCTGGTLDPGFTVVVGKPYFQSNTAGKISDDQADLLNPMRTTFIGVGITASQLAVRIYNSGATVP